MEIVKFSDWEKLEQSKQEEINALYTNIVFSGEKNKIIGILSSCENEGKTFISMELMRTAANDGKKVVFIDADLRKSRIESHYGASLKFGTYKGLTNYLCGGAEIDEIVYPTEIENAFVVFVGQYALNPIKLLNSKKFDLLLRKLSGEYDFIVVDMPPLSAVIDGAIIAKKCDGVAIVVQANLTNYHAVADTKAQLQKAGANILGVVLNKGNANLSRYYGKKTYGRYYGNKQ